MNKLFKNFSIFTYLGLFAMTLASCGGDQGGNKGGSGDTRDTAVYFHYGFANGATLGDDGKVSEYANELKQGITASTGKMKALSTTNKNKFKVDGYVWYFTEEDEAIQKNVIEGPTDIYVRYRLPETFTVTFKNADGSTIKTISKTEGTSLSAAEYPDTSSPILAVDSATYNTFDNSKKSEYKVYTPIDGAYVPVSADLNSSIVTPIGSYFTGWDKTISTIDENVVLTAQLAQTDLVINKSASPVIDGVKDSNYVKVGGLKVHDINPDTGDEKGTYLHKLGAGDWNMLDENNPVTIEGKQYGSPWADANIYIAYDGEFIYVLIESFNQKAVCSLSKEYMEGSENPYAGDTCDLWYGDGINFHKGMVDAFGYGFYSQASNYSTYTPLMMEKTNNMYATSLTGLANGDTLEAYKTAGDHVKTSATGFNVEYKIPAYHDNPNKMTPETTNKNITSAEYGEKMAFGDTFYVALQLNNINDLPSQSTLDTIDAKVQAGQYTEEGNNLVRNDENTQLGFYGYQMNSKARSGYGYKITLA